MRERLVSLRGLSPTREKEWLEVEQVERSWGRVEVNVELHKHIDPAVKKAYLWWDGCQMWWI